MARQADNADHVSPLPPYPGTLADIHDGLLVRAKIRGEIPISPLNVFPALLQTAGRRNGGSLSRTYDVSVSSIRQWTGVPGRSIDRREPQDRGSVVSTGERRSYRLLDSESRISVTCVANRH